MSTEDRTGKDRLKAGALENKLWVLEQTIKEIDEALGPGEGSLVDRINRLKVNPELELLEAIMNPEVDQDYAERAMELVLIEAEYRGYLKAVGRA